MRKFLALAAVAALAVFATVATAQDGTMDPQAMEEMMIRLATPGPQHDVLAKMAGDWTTTMTSYMDGPEPVTSTGTFHSEAALGGRYFVGRHVGTAMGQPFEGMSVDGFDNSTKKFFSFWIDNFGTGYYLAHGELAADGKTITHSGDMTFGPMTVPSRSETVFVDDDTIRFTMWHTMEEQEIKAMDLVYERAK
jgi:hypothetical protein